MVWLEQGIAAAALAAGLVWAIQRSERRWALLVLALGPVVIVYLVGTHNRVASYHGFLHLSIVYQILENGIPPWNPLLAGEPLRYSWAPHLVIAGLARWLSMPPSWAFAGVNVAALGLTVLLLYRTGLRVSGDYRAASLGVALAIFACGIVKLIAPSGWLFDPLGIPPVMKFTNVDAMTVGILCFALFLDAGSQLVSEPARGFGPYLRLLVAVLASGLLYPLLWLGIIVAGGAALLVLLLRFGTPLRPRLLWAGGFAALGMLASLPYLLAITQSERTTAPMHVANLAHVLAFAPTFVLLILPVLLLLAYGYREVWDALRRNEPLAWLLGSVSVASALLCLLISGPTAPGIEYKYRTLSYIPLGLLAGIGVEKLRQHSTLAAFALLSVLLLPMVADLHKKVTRSGIVDGYVEQGIGLLHTDSTERALHEWMIAHTSPRAAFVDVRLSIPVFARRPLFVGVDSRRMQHAVRHRGTPFDDGWGMTAEGTLGKVLGGLPATQHVRREAVAAVLRGHKLDRAAEIFSQELASGEIDALYVVVRNSQVAEVLDADARFERTYWNRGAVVFRFAGADGSGAGET